MSTGIAEPSIDRLSVYSGTECVRPKVYRTEVRQPTHIMSDANDAEEDGGEEDDEVTRERAGRLDEKERRLQSQERELEAREGELDEREAELLERREELVDLREQLETQEADLEEREESVTNREAALQERERELDERAEQLDRQEETLHAYVGDQIEQLEASVAGTVDETVREAIEESELAESQGGYGAISNLLLALVGLVLVVAGVSNLFAVETAVLPAFFASSAANFGASAVLIFGGLAANLAAAAGRL